MVEGTKSTLTGIVRSGFKKVKLSGLRRFHTGQNIYNFDWDVLIILDACRVDLLQSVSEEYEFIDEVDTINSVGTKTTEWMENTFIEQHEENIKKTGYITGNPNSNKYITGKEFTFIDEVWKYAWDDDRGLMPPRPITDRTIKAIRDQRADKYIIHYMQPHEPFISALNLGGKDSWRRVAGFDEEINHNSVWDQLSEGEINKEEVWEAYQKNLRVVLNEVQILLETVESEKIVITSDHGNALGESGYFGHPRNVPIKSIRQVPWVETSAEKKSNYDPKTWDGNTNTSKSVEEKLESLGYL